ncbi:glycerol-3-phosphate cytidylyltransferase [Vibrio alginolyticus]|uniref:adenylyltransferase/cytidyltransferase family protein n=1 Tax=Vibrio alginolyticus TaxID=663 RepID=UPI000CE97C0D|nr:adenylyltransferase/cytidyltransferase family protein [Vibrio alginolyticus]AVF76124.1 glycerol-3-phosphate cytidylyltransferase [Vibrio alginolyticus]
MKTIITYGTFDLFHIGHVRLLKRLSEMADRLVVGISSDEFNAIKGKRSFFSYEERAEIVASCKYVDEVFSEDNWQQKKDDILKYEASIFAIGDDWQGEFDYLNELCEVVYLERTKDISTTDIKKSLSKLNKDKLEEIESSMHAIINVVKSISSQ